MIDLLGARENLLDLGKLLPAIEFLITILNREGEFGRRRLLTNAGVPVAVSVEQVGQCTIMHL